MTEEMRELIRRLRSVTARKKCRNPTSIKDTKPVNPDGDEAANVIQMLEDKIEQQELFIEELYEQIFEHEEAARKSLVARMEAFDWQEEDGADLVREAISEIKLLRAELSDALEYD